VAVFIVTLSALMLAAVLLINPFKPAGIMNAHASQSPIAFTQLPSSGNIHTVVVDGDTVHFGVDIFMVNIGGHQVLSNSLTLDEKSGQFSTASIMVGASITSVRSIVTDSTHIYYGGNMDGSGFFSRVTKAGGLSTLTAIPNDFSFDIIALESCDRHIYILALMTGGRRDNRIGVYCKVEQKMVDYIPFVLTPENSLGSMTSTDDYIIVRSNAGFIKLCKSTLEITPHQDFLAGAPVMDASARGDLVYFVRNDGSILKYNTRTGVFFSRTVPSSFVTGGTVWGIELGEFFAYINTVNGRVFSYNRLTGEYTMLLDNLNFSFVTDTALSKDNLYVVGQSGQLAILPVSDFIGVSQFFTVTFKDIDGNIVRTARVPRGAALRDIDMPFIPIVKDSTFYQWFETNELKISDDITQDTVFWAMYKSGDEIIGGPKSSNNGNGTNRPSTLMIVLGGIGGIFIVAFVINMIAFVVRGGKRRGRR
jgi:hypothetical protein